MRIIYVPRSDAHIVSGGDVLHANLLQQSLNFIDVEIESVYAESLHKYSRADAIYLTQIYQIADVEIVAAWARRTCTPLFICPLFDEGLRMEFRLTLRGRGNWHRLSKLLGKRLAGNLFVSQQTSVRSRQELWQRQRAILQQAHIITNTYYELEHLRKWFKLENPNFTIIPLGIDSNVFNPNAGSDWENLPEQVKGLRGSYLLQVGLISERKNQIGLLLAMDDSRVPLVFVGRQSPYESEYYKETLGIACARGNVVFLDWVSIEALAALYGQAAAHILPSWSERPGLVSLEAAACNCKVVTSITAPSWEYLGKKNVGLCAPQHTRSIRHATLQVLDARLPMELSSYVINRYSWDNTALAFKKALANVINSTVS